MALRMAQPFKRPSGIYHLNARVPADLMNVVPGTRIALPLGDAFVHAKATDKVVISLRTKDLSQAVERCSAAFAALCRHWQALRAGPAPLTHRQIVGLAGEAYRSRTAPEVGNFNPDDALAVLQADEDAAHGWRYGEVDDHDGEIPEDRARFLATLEKPFGAQLLTWQAQQDVRCFYFEMTYAQAIEDLFGSEADDLLARRQLMVDMATRTRLVAEIARAVRLVGPRLLRKLDGDYSPDANLARFPSFVAATPSPVAPPPQRVGGAKVTVDELFERWKRFKSDRAGGTIRRYAPSVASLASFLAGRDVRTIAKIDFERWADHRRDVDGIAPRTVNGNDLVAASSLFAFATTRESDRDADGEKRPLRADNPVKGVKVPEPKQRVLREKTFRAGEISAILTLARGVELGGAYPRAAASRRFTPFICAYSGARIQEVCWLRREDIRSEDGIWTIRFWMTKDGFARTIPLHDALVEEGLLAFWEAAPDGPLFTGDKAQKVGASRPAAEQRASEIAAWIGGQVEIASGASPNHGWRHSFITKAQGPDVRMSKEMACTITGHNRVRDAHDRYVSFAVAEMKKEMDHFPCYRI